MSSTPALSLKLSSHYPSPITIPPLSNHHTSTLILLHGRGSNASTFASPLLSTPLPSGCTFQQSLPTTKFIFPTASIRRATFANRTPITQWFDIYSLDNLELRPEHETGGLRESVAYLHGVIGVESQAVGAENVVVGGLSLGACTALVAALTWNGERLGGVLGMAGRLPLRGMLVSAAGVEEGGGGPHSSVVFEAEDPDLEDAEGHETSPGSLAIRALKDELDIDISSATSIFQSPVLLCHGSEDNKVPVRLGRLAVECLDMMGCDVTWREYAGLGHWYHGEELQDIVYFLRDMCKIASTSKEEKA